MKSFEEIKKQINIQVIDSDEHGMMGYINLSKNRRGIFVFSNGCNWEHLSISLRYDMPTWNDMCIAKDTFFDEEEVCVQYHPAKSHYVNNVKNCLHIWKPIGQNFPTPPDILVGIPGLELK